jgi:hypothetical protein
MPVLSSLNTLAVSDLITDAFDTIGIGGDGETLSAESMQRGLRTLNRMLDSFNSERLSMYEVRRETFAVVAGQQNYSVGPGGDFDTQRPQKLEFATWIDSTGTEYPVRVLTLQEWNRIAVKSQTGDRMTSVYYEPTMPQGTLHCYPVPTGTGTLVLGTWQQFDRFTDINQQVQLPPAYEEAIVNHLAVRLAPSYGQEAPTTVVQLAIKSKANLKRMNAPTIEMRCDPAITGRGCFDIRTGGFER